MGWVVGAVLSQACAASISLQRAVPGDEQVRIAISNETSRAMRFHVYAGETSVPLGTVPALGSRIFVVPPGFGAGAHEFRVEARERGARGGVMTESFVVGSRRVVSVALHKSTMTSVTIH